MLTRAARRRETFRYLQYGADKIQLPWLCPAILHPHTTSATSRPRPIAKRRSTPQPNPTVPLSTHARQLASAAPLPDPFDSNNASDPFLYRSQPGFEDHGSPKTSVSSLVSPDLSRILMIDQTTALPPERLDTSRRKDFDIRGDALDIEATLDACLQVQRWDRAMAILTQLRLLYQSNPQKLQRPYNRVLEAMVYDYIYNRSKQNVSKINKWIESEMRRAGVQPNAHTFALKIKAALYTLQGPKRDRTVRRYWDMAKDYHVDWEVASLRYILSDNDLGKLSEISPIDPIETDLKMDDESQLDGLDITTGEEIVSSPASLPILETDQKGLGMSALKQSLSLFSDARHFEEWEQIRTADETVRDAYAQQRQMRLEEDSLQSAVDRWKVENEKMVKMGITGNITSGRVGALLWQWHKHLSEKITEELAKVEEAELKEKKGPEDRLRCEYGPFLRLVDVDQLSALCSISIMQIVSKSGVGNPHKLARVVTDMGRRVEIEVAAQLKKDKVMRRRANGKKTMATTEASENQPEVRSPAKVLDSDDIDTVSRFNSARRSWTASIHGKVGAILCELLFDCAKVTVGRTDESDQKISMLQPAFQRQSVYENGKRVSIVTVHEDLASLMITEPVADLIAKQLPMISKPSPWTGFREGGFLSSEQAVVRIKHSDHAQRDYSEAAAQRGDLDQLFAGLDVLGKTGWRVNKEVFSVMLRAWNSGEEIANFSPLTKLFEEVPKPAEDASLKEKFAYHHKMKEINNEKSGLHSNRCFQNFQMEIAKAYQDETFYLPHNVDFRGRAYPMPPYLNQMGADNARGLLLFDQGKPLGPNGFKWLKVHLANVFGYDKASLTDRAQFAMDHIDDVRDSVQNPLDGRRWWLSAENPWQCLATCHELLKALDSGDPESFISYLPIHQDGTCNGLQHYAALGGDIEGARQVNLEPGDKPADVYTGVAEMVKADIKKDSMANIEIAQLLDGKVTRKIVKQTVMTNVYGVTFGGAMRQVRKQLDELIPELKHQDKASVAAVYIARKIFKGLGTLFEGAHDIQYWFGDCANRITRSISLAQLTEMAEKDATDPKALTLRRDPNMKLIRRKNAKLLDKAISDSDFRSTVIWTTPLKLPVVQPYRVSQAIKIKTNIGGLTLLEPNVADAVDRRKQLQGFPPNFIHSLDATHMMLSALKANELGLTFSAVHDSFWTHAADVDALNRLLRDAFIRMHSEDIVGRLAAEFKTRYKGHLYLAKIGRNNKLAQAINKYRRSEEASFAQSQKARKDTQELRHIKLKYLRYRELLKEHKRQTLLASSDPVERKEGQKMITAASLYDFYKGEKYLTSKDSLGETALGKLPQADPEALEEALRHEEVPESQDVDLHRALEPLLERSPEEDQLSAASDAGHSETCEPSTEVAKNSAKKSQTKKPTGNTPVWLWLPLTFKPIPKKGDWNVERLRDSTYFFS